jgi:hypothetical protein
VGVGDTATLSAAVSNVGDDPTGGVTVTVSTAGGGLSVVSDSRTVESLEANETATVEFTVEGAADTVVSTESETAGQDNRNTRVTVTGSDGGGLARFDTNDDGETDFGEVAAAIQADNSDGQVGGAPVGFPDALAVIRAFNSDVSG